MSEVIASHSEESQESTQEQEVQDALLMFGFEPQTEAAAEGTKEGELSEPPAIEEEKPSKTIKVKHNKEEIEVDVSDDKLPEYVQKSLALDKERERKTEYEKSLDRVAKLQGFDNHADLIANLDRIEQEAQQRANDQFNDLRQQIRAEAEDAGLDPSSVDKWLDNHPVLQQAQKSLIERQRLEVESKLAQTEQAQRQKWSELYQQYPDLVETSKAFDNGETPEWFTPEMKARIDRGYDPKDAYELAHMGTITAQSKQAAERKAIKDQRLGLRSQVETQGSSDLEPEVPNELASAFSLFGLDPKSAKKYAKK